MQKEKKFPMEVLQVLKNLENNNDSRLPIMQKLTNDNDDFKRMWRHILRAPRRELYAHMSNEEVVCCFLDIIIDSTKEEIPVFYYTEKQKKVMIKKILGHEEKLKRAYEDAFDTEAAFFIEKLCSNTFEAIKRIESSYLRATGSKKIRIISTFVRELAQRNLWVYGEQLNSAIRAAVLAIYNYTYNSDVNVFKLTKGPDETPISPEEIDHLLFGE